MKYLAQLSRLQPQGWEELDSVRQPLFIRGALPTGVETVGAEPRYVTALNVQGVVFKGYDHYHVEDLPDGCRVTVWNDDPGDWAPEEFFAQVWTFKHLKADPKFGGAYNTDQSIVLYADPNGPHARSYRENGPWDNKELRDWSEFIPPADPCHGIWMSDSLYQNHLDLHERRGWREWTEGVPAELIQDGKVDDQRKHGRYLKPDSTMTWYARNLTTSNPAHAADRELQFSTSTASAADLSASFTGSGNEQWNWIIVPNDDDWPSGNYRFQIDATTADGGITYGIKTLNGVAGHFARLDSFPTYADAETWEQSEGTFSGTGLKLATTGTINPASGASTDAWEVMLNIYYDGSGHGMGPWVFTQQVNESDDFTDGPWTAAPTTVTVNAASVTGTAKALSVVLGGITRGLSAGSATFVPKALSRTLGGITPALSAGLATALGKALSVVLGGLTTGLSAGLVTAIPKPLTAITSVTVSVDAASVAATPKPLTAIVSITVSVDAASVTATPKALTLATFAGLDRALTIVLPKPLSYLNPGITFDAASATATAKALSVVPGSVEKTIGTAQAVLVPLAIDTKEKHLNTAQLTAIALPLAVNIIGCDLATITATPKELSLVKSGTSLDVSGSYDPLDPGITDAELQGDATWIEQGAPSIIAQSPPPNVLKEKSYYPYSDYPPPPAAGWPGWTEVPTGGLSPIRSRWLDEDPPDDDGTYLTSAGAQPFGTSFIRDTDGLTAASFPDLRSGSIIIKVMLKARAKISPAAGNVDFTFWFGAPPSGTFTTSLPPVSGLQLQVGSRSGIYADYQWDLDRVPQVFSFATPDPDIVAAEGGFWTVDIIRKMTAYGFGAGSQTGVDAGTRLTAMKVTVVYIEPDPPFPQGILMRDSSSGAWHHWRSKEN